MAGDVGVGEYPAARGVHQQAGAEPAALVVLDERLVDGRAHQHGPVGGGAKGVLARTLGLGHRGQQRQTQQTQQT